ncbi:hypothetical protein SporoS204_07715 [Sporosarcina ureae]|uniref:Uncharacterized protein n=1 Tax=Sporosarcina ureae TaxID=1571 RepID=A0ABM6JVS3_SPOUR|nr:hypothetical protein SporoS204_07715 [Sporosarcina ureae]
MYYNYNKYQSNKMCWIIASLKNKFAPINDKYVETSSITKTLFMELVMQDIRLLVFVYLTNIL